MATNTWIRSGAWCAPVLALLASLTVATTLAGPTQAATTVSRSLDRSARDGYGWPVKPFHAQHPVRGAFGDPRIGTTPSGTSKQFHFGVDVFAPNGTPVYATISGSVSIHDLHPDVVLIDAPGGVRFEYWHVVPAVRGGAHAVAYVTVIGYVEKPWAHVHFSEWRDGRYVNPLRPGAMGPFADRTKPTVAALQLEHEGQPVRLVSARGTLDLVAEVREETPMAVPSPWNDLPVIPARIRWRFVGSRAPASGWRTAADFTTTIPGADTFDGFFARWTRQNHANRSGRYRVYLAHGWNSSSVPDGKYRVAIEAADIRGNVATATFSFTVANDS